MKIFYVSFLGRYSDNPRAIYEELKNRNVDAEHTWRCQPGYADQFPAGVHLVTAGSDAEAAAFADADILICNTTTDLLTQYKKPGAFYLQTWHGTALKRIYFDELQDTKTPLELKMMEAGSGSWDALISPNHFSTETQPSAFRFSNEVWETGYPRNDLLNSAEGQLTRTKVRQELGVADDKTAVLYTPTFRDNEVDDNGSHTARLVLDVDNFTNELGDDHVLLLRLHWGIDPSTIASDDPRVINVSSHADIRELYMASDVLVTDYSSTMFDFAVTGKPIIFFTYDLESYRDDLRGFYFDLLEEAPGPVVRTNAEVVQALVRLEADKASYGDRYKAFSDRFCHLDDGFAARRVVDRLIQRS